MSADSKIPEIEGLRALAVVSVVMFHAFPTWLPGGFIGVDMFFVISGFVIARAYGANLLAGASLSDFFTRRVRRLAPAYFAVLLASLGFAIVFFDPVSLAAYGEAFAAQATYLQNAIFWYQGDYFHAAWTRPLLHTWSLAVEEQFYLLFAVAILLLRRWPSLLWPILLLALVVSFFLGFVISDISAKTAFFHMPFRIWEFALGIIASIGARNWVDPAPFARKLIAAGALLVLLFAVTLFNENAAFPGAQSILACLAITGILSIVGNKHKISTLSLLRSPSSQHIGQLSYSLYLWHWPIICAAYTLLGRAPNHVEALSLLPLVYICSLGSFHLIEEPVRRKRYLNRSAKLLKGFVLSSVVILTFGLFLVFSQGMVFRFEPRIQNLYIAAQSLSQDRCSRIWRIFHPSREFCQANQVAASDSRPGALILGDSHADRLDEVLGELGENLNVPVYLTVRNCDLNQYGTSKKCSAEVFEKILIQSAELGVKTILAVSKWNDTQITQDGFTKWLEKLTARDMRLYISETVPLGPSMNPRRRARALSKDFTDWPVYSSTDYANQVEHQRAVFGGLARRWPNVTVLSPGSYLCASGLCQAFDGERPLYHDDDHLTDWAVRQLLGIYGQALR